MDGSINGIIHAGILAPSGDNCQPWRFETGADYIDLHLLPERDTSLYSWGHRASYIANGAVLENMAIAASHKGVGFSISLFPNSEQPFWVARASITESKNERHPLYESIWKRCTNRRPYDTEPLTREQRVAFEECVDANGPSLKLVYEIRKQRALAGLLALNERVLFENRHMHSFFFSHINWNEEQDRNRKLGFSLKTFELPRPVEAGFAVFKHYPIMRALNTLGASSMVAKINAGIYATGGAIGAVLLRNRSIPEFIEAGRLFQRIWLTATFHNLHLQPLTGIPLLMNRVAAGDGALSPTHIGLISRAYKELSHSIGATSDVIAFMFRIGKADEPSARTHRLPPDIRPT